MIQMPRRSVTRFFIPLIDVLTLLFCIFLFMPMVRPPDRGFNAVASREDRLRQLQQELERLKKKGMTSAEEERLKEELRKLREEFARTLQQRLVVRVLHVSPQTGRLFYYNENKRETYIKSQEEAEALIDADRRSQGSNQREVYYLIQYPSEPGSPFPLRGQREQYDQWFKGVPHGYDIPGSGPARGDLP
jgi:hypothetical protein